MAEQQQPRITPTPLEAICLDGGTQIREKLDEAYIKELHACVERGKKLPPIVVYWDAEAKKFYLADGFHRFYGHQRAGSRRMLTEMRHGTLQDAIRHAIQSNHTHGLRRTNKDKKNCVLKALADPEWTELSDRNLADKCGVDHMTIAKFRKKATADSPTVPPEAGGEVRHLNGEGDTPESQETTAPETRVGRDGKRYPVQTPEPTVEAPKDRLGNALPRRLLAVFEAGRAMEGYARKLGKIAKEAVEGLKDKPEARALDLVGLDNHLTTAKNLLRDARPYCICPLCKGRGCEPCRKSGWLTKTAYTGIPRDKQWPKRDAA